DPPTPPTYTLSLHDALPIFLAAAAGDDTIVFAVVAAVFVEQLQQLLLAVIPIDVRFPLSKTARVAHAIVSDMQRRRNAVFRVLRSEEHTSELQSRGHLVCRL